MINREGVERQCETLTQIMVVFFLPLFGHHSRVVFCQKKLITEGNGLISNAHYIWGVKDNGHKTPQKVQ